MKTNDIVADARVARVRELKAALAEATARATKAETERDALLVHFDIALAALFDFANLDAAATLRIIDGWNLLLRTRTVSKLSSEEISKLKTDYLASLGVSQQAPDNNSAANEINQPLSAWIIFDGAQEKSYRCGPFRVTYTGGSGPHRADRMILDYVHAAKLLGLDISRITIETADKSLTKRLECLGAKVAVPEPF